MGEACPALGKVGGKTASMNVAQLVAGGQFQVLAARAMAGFTAHVDFLVGGVEAAGTAVVVFLQVGAVAFGAAGIPVGGGASPVQWIREVDGFVGEQVVPALATLFPGPCIPGDCQCLQATPREWQQVLLQGVDTEHVGHLEVGELAVLTVGTHHEFFTVAVKAAGNAVVGESSVIEITQHGFCGG